MKPINRAALDRAAIKNLLAQQIVLSVATIPRTIWLKAYFVETDTEGLFKTRYEVVSMNDIVLSTVNLDEAIGKYIDLSKPTTDTVDVLQVANRTEPSFETKPDF